MKLNIFSEIFLISTFLFIFFTSSIEAEDKPQMDSTSYLGGWGSLGVGGCYAGPTGYFSFTIVYNNNIFNIRYITSGELRFNPGGGDYKNPALSIQEYGVLYGRTFREKILMLSASAGIGYILGIDRGRQMA
jgi:hypothetical protein